MNRNFFKFNKLELASLIVLQLIIYFISIPGSANMITHLETWLLNYFTKYYVLLGYVILFVLLGLSFSSVRFSNEKPEYSLPSWLGMIFTSTLAADIMYFSLIDWTNYITVTQDTYIDAPFSYDLSLVYPMLHWGISAWGFYVVPSVIYSYLIHHKKDRVVNYSDALGISNSHKSLSLILNSIGIVVLVLAVATTYSIATPLPATLLSNLFGLSNIELITVIIILGIGVSYSVVALKGKLSIIKNISNITCILYLLILLILLSQSDIRLVSHIAYESLTYLITNLSGLTLFISSTSFTTDTTVFYWAYWIAWSVANPFFIAKISKGRTMRELTVLGTLSSVLGTFVSFIIMSGYTITNYHNGITNTDNTYTFVLSCIINNEYSSIVIVLISVCMILLYITTLDSLTYILCEYCNSSKFMKIVWALLLVTMPILLITSNYDLNSLQSIDIILALPISLIMIALFIRYIVILRRENHHQ